MLDLVDSVNTFDDERKVANQSLVDFRYNSASRQASDALEIIVKWKDILKNGDMTKQGK